MVPADSTGVPLAPTYSGYPYHSSSLPVRDSHPLRLTFPGYSSFDHKQTAGSYNPHLAVTTWVWANPRSLATTCGITIVFSSSGYLDVSVLRVRLLINQNDTASLCQVVLFGNLRINSHVPIPVAYRSLSRPSSPLGAKASPIRPYLLPLMLSLHSIIDKCIVFMCLLSFTI